MNNSRTRELEKSKGRTQELDKSKNRKRQKSIATRISISRFLDFSSSRFRVIVFLSLYLSSCSPYRFALQKNTGWDIEGRILKNKEYVNVADNNHLIISDSARVAMRCVQLTDGVFDSELQFDNAGKLLLQFRTTPFDDSVNHRSGFTISLSEFEAIVSNADTTIITPVLLPTKAPFRLIVNQLGDCFDVEVACTNAGRIHNADPSTQWIIASLPEGGQVHFIDPRFKPITSDQ